MAGGGGTGNRMVRLALYQGPLDLLLTIAQRGDLPPLEVPVSEVARQAQPGEEEGSGEDLALCAELVRLKAQALIPPPAVEEEEEEEETDRKRQNLEDLRLPYRRLAEVFARRLERGLRSFPRGVSAQPPAREAVEVTASRLKAAMERLLKRADREGQRQLEIPRPRPGVEETLDGLRRDLAAGGGFWLFAARAPREERVVRLLAALEIARLQEGELWQEVPFGPVWLGRKDDASESPRGDDASESPRGDDASPFGDSWGSSESSRGEGEERAAP